MSGNPYGVTSPEKKAELLQRKSSTPLSLKRHVTFNKGLRSKIVEMIRTANPDANVNYDHLSFKVVYDKIQVKVVDDPEIARLYNNPDQTIEFSYNVPSKAEVLNLLFDNVSDVYDYSLYDQVMQQLNSLSIRSNEDQRNGTYDVIADDNLKMVYINYPGQNSGGYVTDDTYQSKLISGSTHYIYFIREEASDKQDINFGNNNLNYNTSDMYSSQPSIDG